MDHIHSVEVTVYTASGGHRHTMSFVGPPGEVAMRHLSIPVELPPALDAVQDGNADAQCCNWGEDALDDRL